MTTTTEYRPIGLAVAVTRTLAATLLTGVITAGIIRAAIVAPSLALVALVALGGAIAGFVLVVTRRPASDWPDTEARRQLDLPAKDKIGA